MFSQRYGPTALVLGASEGLGAEFARQLAGRGLDVVLVARRAEALATIEGELARQVKVRCVVADLATPAALATVAAATADLDVGLVVYNAALSPLGAFLSQSLDENLKAVDVNVRGPIAFAHHFGARLAARGRGGLVLLSSLTAFQGSPFVSTYGATKAFNLAFAEGLWFELKERGVDVLSVCAGATKTPNLLKAAPDGAPGMLEPKQVVTEALDALGRAPTMIPGVFNRFASFLMRRILPRRTTITIMGQQTKKLHAGR
ncbi:MAG: SDR family NAD(P)-dependent oxidoreductase [Myxococcaceae bacterium]|nr:SDR family NAD(P)-dependent oxidoreductase [Myxococcaceae bacterium]